MRASVLDLGSNSFHVLVADVGSDGSLVPVTREREMLHLGRAVAEHGAIPDELRRRAVGVVAHLTELAHRQGATTHHAVATSALRDATNGPEVLAEMARAAGTPIRLVPGVEEARLGYVGVRAATGATGCGLTVLDLGGGSLEVATGTGRDPDVVCTSPLGVSRLSALVHADPPSADDRDRLDAALRSGLDDLVEDLPGRLPTRTVAVGGTVRALGRLVAADGPWTPATINRLSLPTSRLRELRDQLLELDVDGRTAVPGMKSRRADHLHVAAVVLVAVLERLGVEELEVCDWGLREGVLLDAAGMIEAPTPDQLRTREVTRLIAAFPADGDHRNHVAALAGELFDLTGAIHGLGPVDRALLVHAARLHDVGAALALRRHHRHGAYIIEHAELRGFTPDETAQLVTLTRFHNSKGIDPAYPPYVAMGTARRDRTAALLALLQIADGLDRTRDRAVAGLDLEGLDDDRVVLRLHGRGLTIAREELSRRTALFRRTFGRTLEVHDASVPAAGAV
jgi:exopolyphosphatase/guanosine-5'-triphosphate,3'-diphosphate pyrophosphatase